jgi:hypothetical protein
MLLLELVRAKDMTISAFRKILLEMDTITGQVPNHQPERSEASASL